MNSNFLIVTVPNVVSNPNKKEICHEQELSNGLDN